MSFCVQRSHFYSVLLRDVKRMVMVFFVVEYFNQRTHDCACVRMVENDWKSSKIIKNLLFSVCVWEAWNTQLPVLVWGKEDWRTDASKQTQSYDIVKIVVSLGGFSLILFCFNSAWRSTPNFSCYLSSSDIIVAQKVPNEIVSKCSVGGAYIC